MRLLHIDELKDLASNAPSDQLEGCIDELNQGIEEKEVNTPLRLSHFLAQLLYFTDELSFDTRSEFRTIHSFLLFWGKHKCNKLADRDDLDAIIEVFANDVGIATRLNYWNRAIAILRG